MLDERPNEKWLKYTVRKMVWKPKGILKEDNEIKKPKKCVSFSDVVEFDNGSRRCGDSSLNHILDH